MARLRVHVRVTFHTVKKGTWLELLQPHVFASDKEKCSALNQTCNTCGHKGHFSGAKFCKQTKRSQGSSKQFTPVVVEKELKIR